MNYSLAEKKAVQRGGEIEEGKRFSQYVLTKDQNCYISKITDWLNLKEKKLAVEASKVC